MSDKQQDNAVPEEKLEKGFFTRLEEWNTIEELVMKYKEQFNENATEEQIQEAKDACGTLLHNFNPLIKKYLMLIKSSQVDFNDKEMKRFVLGFIGDVSLKQALKRDKQTAELRHLIMSKFNFVKETYGNQPEEVIMTDLQMMLLILAKRYKQMGRNFCAYVYHTYCYEVSRHIKKYIKNPSNIHYKNCEYEDYMQSCVDKVVEDGLDDKTYENNVGIPDMTWVNGTSCSDLFSIFNPLERKILIKYYLEDYNDRQIAEELGIHINTCNQKRRQVISKLAKILDIDEAQIKRNRNSGKKVLLNLK